MIIIDLPMHPACLRIMKCVYSHFGISDPRLWVFVMSIGRVRGVTVPYSSSIRPVVGLGILLKFEKPSLAGDTG